MNYLFPRGLAVSLTGCLLLGSSAFAADPLAPQTPVKLPGKAGKFDFIHVDGDRGRLLAAHTGNGALEVIDLAKGEVIKSVPTGNAQDSAIANGGAEYLVSVSKPPQLAIVDAATLQVTGTVPLPGPADLVVCNPVTGLAYVCHDDGQEIWVVSPQDKKITATITLPTEGPEGVVVDTAGKHLFQAMKIASTLACFDLGTNKLVSNWPTAPAQSPHGIALVPDANAIAIAGGNGKLVLMSQGTGQILSSTDIPQRVDEIAYDEGNHTIYCASGQGKIASISMDNGQLKPLGDVPSQPGAHSVAVNPKDHTVWTAYMGTGGSYVQGFTAR